jgi:hypothetical protein
MAIHTVRNIPRLIMVKANARPTRWFMACFAEFAGGQMILRFACRFDAVVACGASINNSLVIEYANVPGGRDMARTTFIVRSDVIEWLSFGPLIVVAILARFLRHCMIELRNHPRRGLVAIGAVFRGLDMGLALALCGLAVVAGNAIRFDFGMVNVDGCKGRVAVTVYAIVGCLRMLVQFALCHVTIMTTKARCWHAFEHRAFMAGFAGHFLVRAFEWKACKFMVESQVNFDSGVGNLCASRHEGKRKHHGKHHD